MMVAGADVAMVRTEVDGWGEIKGRGAGTDLYQSHSPLRINWQTSDWLVWTDALQ